MATITKTTTIRLRPKDRARLDALIEWDRRQTGLRASASTVVRSLLFGFVDELIERGEIDDKLLRTRAAAYRAPAADSLRRDRRERREWQTTERRCGSSGRGSTTAPSAASQRTSAKSSPQRL